MKYSVTNNFQQVDYMLDQFVTQSEPIQKWIAELQTLLMPKITRDKYLIDDINQLDDGDEFSIMFHRVPKISEVRILSIIQWWLPKEGRVVIFECILKVWKRLNLTYHIDISVYMSGKINTILYLQNASEFTPRSFFGTLTQTIKKFPNRDNLWNPTIPYAGIIPITFWFSNKTKVTKYTGWSRHHKDHGSLRPNDNGAAKEFQIDEICYEIERKQEEYRIQTEDLIQLTLGWIQ